MNTLKSPELIARDILVRPAPNGQLYFNGMLTLEATVRAVEPATDQMPARVVALLVRCVARELGLHTRPAPVPVPAFELVPAA